jgi:glycosyltransferase involved in cell wall biosynthesis
VENTFKVISFNEEMIGKLKTKLPEFNYEIIKQSIEIKNSSTFSIRKLLNIPDNGYVTLFPAGIRKVKDPKFVLNELLEILKLNKDHYVVLIGAKLDEALDKEIREMTKYEERFIILDVIDHGDFANVIKESNLIINTSISEGMSNVLMEGMYLGVPIIARENEGNSKLIKHNFNGFIFKTPKEFSELYNELYSNTELRTSLIHNAQEHMFKEYGIEKETNQYNSILNEVLVRYYHEYKGMKLYFPERVHPYSHENNNLFEVSLS